MCNPDEVGAVVVGPVTRVPYVCRKCSCNAHNALCNRHGARQPPIVRSFDLAYALVDELLPQVMSEYVAQLVVWQTEWIGKWPEVKRRLIAKSVLEDPVKPSVVLCMVKREHGHSRPSKARNIQYYYNLAT